jgi:hypothetical protein
MLRHVLSLYLSPTTAFNTVLMKVEKYIIAIIAASLISTAVMLVIMYVKTFTTEVSVFIGNVIMCLISH